jgi:hypothetical protein
MTTLPIGVPASNPENADPAYSKFRSSHQLDSHFQCQHSQVECPLRATSDHSTNAHCATDLTSGPTKSFLLFAYEARTGKPYASLSTSLARPVAHNLQGEVDWGYLEIALRKCWRGDETENHGQDIRCNYCPWGLL